jgi:hypothetical protein
MTDSWWAKKLGRGGTTVAPNIPPVGYPPAGQLPGAAQSVPQPGWAAPAPTMQTVWVEDPYAPSGKRFNWRGWQGGQGNREETGRCPNCGGTNYFSRRQNAVVTANGMASPAPQCFDCSYNGRFQIFGGS